MEVGVQGREVQGSRLAGGAALLASKLDAQ